MMQEWRREQLLIARAQVEMERCNQWSLARIAIRETSGMTPANVETVHFLPVLDNAKLTTPTAWNAMSSLMPASAWASPLPLSTALPLTVLLSWQLLIKQMKSHVTSTSSTPKMTKKPLKYCLKTVAMKAPYWRNMTKEDVPPEERERQRSEQLAQWCKGRCLTRHKADEFHQNSGRTSPHGLSPSK